MRANVKAPALEFYQIRSYLTHTHNLSISRSIPKGILVIQKICKSFIQYKSLRISPTVKMNRGNAFIFFNLLHIEEILEDAFIIKYNKSSSGWVCDY